MRIKIKYYFKSLKYTWFFLRTINSPFVPLSLKIYFGKIEHGVPYFLPTIHKKYTKQDCITASEKSKVEKPLIKIKHDPDYYKNHTKPTTAKYFHFKMTELGWKTKFGSFRFEWSPSISLVLFGKQLFITVYPKADISNYWEAFLSYQFETDIKKSKEERLMELFSKHSCSWINNEGITDYYLEILRPEWVEFYKNKK